MAGSSNVRMGASASAIRLSMLCMCQFGADWDKSWLFVCNHACIHDVAAICPHPKHSHQQVAGVKLADGSFFSRLTAAYPDALADALSTCFAPYLTKKGLMIRLSDWIQSIPRQPTWQFAVSQGRIEDGGSLASTAFWASPQHPDVLHQLRGRWHKRLMCDGLALKIAGSLRDGNPEPSVEESTLSLFLSDIQSAFNIDDGEWHHMILQQRFIYVDDILAALDSKSSPIYASMIVLMCMCLGVPLSWKKAQLQSEVVWIGWEISARYWTTLTAEKRGSILEDLSELLRVHKIPLKLFERLTGKLLWVTSAWHQLRPLLNPFYYTLSSPSPTLISLSPTEWTQLLQSLDEAGVITAPMSHPSLQVGVRVFRVGNTNVSSIQQLRLMSFRSRRIWVSISDPNSTWRKLTAELKCSAAAWKMLLSSRSLVSMLPRPTLTCQAAADDMANDTLVGIGGYVIFPSGVSGWYQII